MPELYALAGEKVTCIKGHYIATFSQDVYVGQIAERQLFTDIDSKADDQFVKGRKCGKCPHCDSYFTIGGDGRGSFWIDGQWRYKK